VLEAKGGKPPDPSQKRGTMKSQLSWETTMALLKKLAELPLSKDELAIIAWLEKGRGRKLTQQEINLSLRQARDLGEL